jgi:hypothetical protein
MIIENPYFGEIDFDQHDDENEDQIEREKLLENLYMDVHEYSPLKKTIWMKK